MVIYLSVFTCTTLHVSAVFAVIACPSGCLSMSITCWHRVWTAKPILKLFQPSDSPRHSTSCLKKYATLFLR